MACRLLGLCCIYINIIQNLINCKKKMSTFLFFLKCLICMVFWVSLKWTYRWISNHSQLSKFRIWNFGKSPNFGHSDHLTPIFYITFWQDRPFCLSAWCLVASFSTRVGHITHTLFIILRGFTALKTSGLFKRLGLGCRKLIVTSNL